MNVDIVIVASSKDCDLRDMTQLCINSFHNSSDTINFSVKLIETFKKTRYRSCEIYEYIQNKFNYNSALNYGASKCKSEYIGFFNNDVFAKKNWCETTISDMRKYKTYSCSPYSSNIKRLTTKDIMHGYGIRQQLFGWAIFMHKSVYKKIKGFNTDVEFWYSDNVYADQLKKAGIKHMVCYNSIVDHLENKTLNTLPQQEKIISTHFQRKKYLKTLEKFKYKFSVIMPSYLQPYKGNEVSTEVKKEKLRRAINSVLKQSYKSWELIIISDGCDDTVDIYQEFSENENIKCLKVKKQKMFSGYIRQVGIDNSQGELIIYLDSDDKYGKNHLKNINKNFQSDWVYFNDYVNKKERISSLKVNHIGTSCICHKKTLGVSWAKCNNYGHDWIFIKKLLNYNGKKIKGGQYHVCHIPHKYEI